MTVVSIIKGRTIKSVSIDLVSESDTEDQILALAMEAAGETKDRLFGWSVNVFDGLVAVVDLHTN